MDDLSGQEQTEIIEWAVGECHVIAEYIFDKMEKEIPNCTTQKQVVATGAIISALLKTYITAISKTSNNEVAADLFVALTNNIKNNLIRAGFDESHFQIH